MSHSFISPENSKYLIVGDQKFLATDVIHCFNNLITPERLQKIESVVQARSNSVHVVLENIYDKGNISAVMRSAEAFGFHKFTIIQPHEKFKDSQRVSQGAEKWLQLKKFKQTKPALEELKNQGLKIYTTALTENSKNIEDLSLDEPIALVLGNEKDGVSKEALDLSDGNVLVPMSGFTQSFNISVAGALCFQSLKRNAKRLNPEEALILKADYILKSLQHSEDRLLKVLRANINY